MTKTLTEQWREGRLPIGNYYIRVKEQGEEKTIVYNITAPAFFYDQNVLLEIVEPVPSYDKHKQLVSKTEQLVQKMHILEDRLEIATKALEDILNDGDDYWDKDKAQEALKEMEGVK